MKGTGLRIEGQSSWRQFKCPVCEGRGIVPHGFYMHPAGQPFTSSSTAPDKCRSCNGHGIVWGYG